MPKALFFNVPGHGHITPSLPFVAELTRRGHQIIYYASAGFRRVIEGTGATFRPYRSIADDYFTARGLHGGRRRAGSCRRSRGFVGRQEPEVAVTTNAGRSMWRPS